MDSLRITTDEVGGMHKAYLTSNKGVFVSNRVARKRRCDALTDLAGVLDELSQNAKRAAVEAQDALVMA